MASMSTSLQSSFEGLLVAKFSDKKRKEFLKLAQRHAHLREEMQQNEVALKRAAAKLLIWNHREKMRQKKNKNGKDETASSFPR